MPLLASSWLEILGASVSFGGSMSGAGTAGSTLGLWLGLAVGLGDRVRKYCKTDAKVQPPDVRLRIIFSTIDDDDDDDDVGSHCPCGDQTIVSYRQRGA